MTTEERRHLARASDGVKALVRHVLEPVRDQARQRLQHATGHYAVYEAAITWREVDRVIAIVAAAPGQAIEQLQNEGDALYG